VSRFKAVEPTQAEGGHSDEAAGQGEGGHDAVRTDEAMSGSDDLVDAWPHRNHSAATLTLRVRNRNAKFIHFIQPLSTPGQWIVRPKHPDGVRSALTYA
jgi:hypothetical protein